MFSSWYKLVMLAAESQQVVWLRTLKLASGGAAAADEARMMVTEKIAAASHATERLMVGDSPDSIVDTYRETVRANAERLSKP
jgi:cytochrome c551/c552